MKTCLRCREWNQKRCSYRTEIRSTWLQDENLHEQTAHWLETAVQHPGDKDSRWKLLEPLRAEFKRRLSNRERAQRGLFYCYFAHLVDDWQHHASDSNEMDLRKIGRDVLVDIDTFGLG